jgi:uncharacterized membrane protein
MRNMQAFLNPLEWTFFKTEFHRWLAASIFFSVILVTIRIVLSGDLIFTFLIWNLFLGYIPYAISRSLSSNTRTRQGRFIFLFVFLIWLLFIPNSFYIITDLFHLGRFGNMPLWYDLTLILSFAWNGILLGIFSVYQMEKNVEVYIKRKPGLFFLYPVMFLNALGIYIGRYLRFNSWDVLADPFHLITAIADLALHPIEYKYVWGMVICFSIFMTLIYLTVISANKGTRMEVNG